MSKIDGYRCDWCKTSEATEDSWLPKGWIHLEVTDRNGCTDEHLCDRCAIKAKRALKTARTGKRQR